MRLEPIRENFWLRLLEHAKSPSPERDRRRARSQGCTLRGSDTSPFRDIRHQSRSPSVGRISQKRQQLRQRPIVVKVPLPPELWEAIFRVATPGMLCTFRAVCSSWRRRLDDPEVDTIWEAAYQREFHDPWLVQSSASPTSWRVSFLARWWTHDRWGVRQPTVCTLMGKKAHGGTVTCVALGRCGMNSGEGTAVSASDDGSLFLWRFSRGALASTNIGAQNTVAQQHHRQCQGGDVRCPQRAKQFYGHAGPVWCLWFDPDQDLLLSGGYDATVKLWSLAGERCEATLRGHDGWVRSLQVLEGGRRVISGGSDGLLKFWSLDSLQCLHSSGPPNNDPRHSADCLAAIEGQEALLAGYSSLRHLLRWDLRTMQFSESFAGHEDDIYAIHAESSSSLLVSGSKDRTVKLWDMRIPSGRCVSTLRAHTGAVLDLKLRGNRIVSASMDKTVRMWDIRQRHAPLATLEGHSAEVHSVDFTDRMVLSGSRDTSLKVWTVI